MHPHESLDELVPLLVRRGLPADYARQTIAELQDHQADLEEELLAAGLGNEAAAEEALRRLGEPRTLVKKTAGEYQRRYWCGRWPLVTFLFGPAMLWMLGWILIGLVLFCVSWPLEQLGLSVKYEPDGVVSTAEYVVNRAMQALLLFVAPGLVMLVFARLARRAAMSAGWVCLSGAIMGLLVGLFVFDFARAVNARFLADQQVVAIGLPALSSGNGFWMWYLQHPLHVCQCLLPLAVAVAMMLRTRQHLLQSGQPIVDGC